MAARKPIVSVGGRRRQLPAGDTLVGAEPPVTAGTTAQFWSGDKTWQSLLSAVQGTLLTGYAVGANAALVAADNVLGALQKLQAQVSARLPLAGGVMTGSIKVDAANIQSVAYGMLYNGNSVWNIGREASRDEMRIWYYTDAGVFQNSFTFTRAGTFTAPGSISTPRLDSPAIIGGHVVGVATGNGYNTLGLEAQGNGGANSVFPGVGFHQPSLWACTLQARSDGQFYFYTQAGALGAVTAADFYGRATELSGGRASWASLRANTVANMLGWKNYGNGHIIFDASAGTSPEGAAVDRTNAQQAWVAQYPTLMGWNGTNTYGVRVDSARIADGLPDTGWINPTLINGWQHYSSTVSYRKIGKVVYIKGGASGGATNTAAFTLPPGYRPLETTRIMTTSNIYLVGNTGAFVVQTDGVVMLFDIGSTGGGVTVNCDCSFVAA